ncbi:MAG: hypothetical protein KBI01_04420 [Oscillospiraceae bacterium]|nr:hypothetical protein [Oscillospiraceae bacterium]
MSNNELTISNGDISQLLTEEDEIKIQAKLWQLLARRTELYTMGDSSSVRIETAQELLQSISFCLDLYLKQSGNTKGILATADPEELFKLGQKVLEEQLELGKKLYSKACLTSPEIENTSYTDTLRSIGSFFKKYDYRFFSHLIPCDIDYQLCHAVNEHLQGVEYVNQYLGRIIIENAFVRKFEKNAAVSLLNSYCSDYKGLLINLYEPIAVNAIGLTLLHEKSKGLGIASHHQQRLLELFETLTVTPAKKALVDAANRVCAELEISDPSSVRYLRKTAEELYPRIEAALPSGKLGGIFLPFNETLIDT